MLFSGANPTQALMMFSSIARCFDNAFTTGVPGGTCIVPNTIISFATFQIYMLYIDIEFKLTRGALVR